MSIDVLGLGAIAMDHVLNCGQLPEEDGYVVINSESLMPGGSCANVITALAGLGTRSGFIARVGDDDNGRKLMADLQAHGVCTHYVSVKKNGVSMHTYVAVAQNGSKAIFCNMGDSLLSLAEDDVSPDMLHGVRYFYTAMQPGKPALKLARLCREKGIPVICNLQVEPEFLHQCDVSSSVIREMLSLSALIITFRNGLVRYSGQDNILSAAESVYETYRPGMGLIVTLGKEGAMWFDGAPPLRSPAFNVVAKDTTGAGDAFIGGLIHARFFEGLDRQPAMTFASACAALKCLQPGPRFRASKSEVLTFMEQHETL